MNRQQMISSGLLVAMALAYWLLLAKNELAEIRSIKGEVQALRSSLIASEVAITRLEEVQGQVEEVDAWLEQAQAFYEAGEASSDFLLDIARSLKACGLTPSEASPGPVQELEPLTRQSIRIVVEGELGDVFDFLHRMEDSRPLCRVTGLLVEPATSAGEIRANLTLLRLWKEV